LLSLRERPDDPLRVRPDACLQQFRSTDHGIQCVLTAAERLSCNPIELAHKSRQHLSAIPVPAPAKKGESAKAPSPN
jgi:hypothetical protein